MIEKYMKNELTRKRWRRFKSRKLAVASSIILIGMIIATLIAGILANSKPIYLKYNDKSYFPVFKTYNPKDFGITDLLVIDYRSLELKESDFALWPPIKWDPFESNELVDEYPSPPTLKNWFGTDESGRDVFTRLLYGFYYSILYALCVWGISVVIGVILGGIMGYFGGMVDFLGQRVVEILSTVPQLFLLIILISIFTPSLSLLVIVTSLFSWIPMSYYIRAEFLKNRKKEFVEAAKSMGASTPKILFKHILPNSLVPIITFAPFSIATNIISLSMLDYLGFGLEIPTPSWGELLAQAQKHYTIAWWLAVYPSLALFSSLTLLNLIGEGVRDAMDPNAY